LSDGERLAVIWFISVVLFFSFSKSQLASYVAPAIPAASAFIAFRFATSAPHLRAWVVQAVLTTTLVATAFAHPEIAAALLEPRLRSLTIVTAIAVLATVWLAVLLARRDEWRAIAMTFAGCGLVYAAIVIAWPRCGVAREMVALRSAIVQLRSTRHVEVVTYHTFLRGLPWLLQELVPFVDPGGELAEGVESLRDTNSPLAWTETRFWQRWQNDRDMVVALVREKDIQEFERGAGEVPFIVARARRHLLVSRLPPIEHPSQDPRTSVALYASELGGHSRPVLFASVPQHVLQSAQRAFHGQPVVHCAIERTESGETYELASGGPVPRLAEVDPDGLLVYTEELVSERTLPGPVIGELRRVAPEARIVFVKKERPHDRSPSRYEILVSGGGVIREVEIDEAGRLSD
jgi:hypothetical protein